MEELENEDKNAVEKHLGDQVKELKQELAVKKQENKSVDVKVQ